MCSYCKWVKIVNESFGTQFVGTHAVLTHPIQRGDPASSTLSWMYLFYDMMYKGRLEHELYREKGIETISTKSSHVYHFLFTHVQTTWRKIAMRIYTVILLWLYHDSMITKLSAMLVYCCACNRLDQANYRKWSYNLLVLHYMLLGDPFYIRTPQW